MDLALSAAEVSGLLFRLRGTLNPRNVIHESKSTTKHKPQPLKHASKTATKLGIEASVVRGLRGPIPPRNPKP